MKSDSKVEMAMTGTSGIPALTAAVAAVVLATPAVVAAPAAVAGPAASTVTAVDVVLAPASAARECPPGFIENPYNSQCLAPVSTPTINGVPCVPSNLGLCSSFVQNQQPPRVPKSSVG